MKVSSSGLLLFCLLGFGGMDVYSQDCSPSDWWGRFCSQFQQDQRKNNALPQPFSSQDQWSVRQTFSPMLAKGARINRILDSVHFEPSTHGLNSVGKKRLREIISQQKPLDILVGSTLDAEVDKQRLRQLRAVLGQLDFPGDRPRVSLTHYLPYHHNGSEKSDLRKGFWAAQKSPTLESVAGDISGSAQ